MIITPRHTSPLVFGLTGGDQGRADGSSFLEFVDMGVSDATATSEPVAADLLQNLSETADEPEDTDREADDAESDPNCGLVEATAVDKKWAAATTRELGLQNEGEASAEEHEPHHIGNSGARAEYRGDAQASIVIGDYLSRPVHTNIGLVSNSPSGTADDSVYPYGDLSVDQQDAENNFDILSPAPGKLLLSSRGDIPSTISINPLISEARRISVVAHEDIRIEELQDLSPGSMNLSLRMFGGGAVEGASHPLTTGVPVPPAGGIIHQIAERLENFRGNYIEIVLTPEELGRVRLLISGSDKPSIEVIADCKEILDLLRRNVGMLAKELRDAGFSDANISFSSGDGREGRDETPRGGQGAKFDDMEPSGRLRQVVETRTPARGSSQVLDIKI